MRDRSRTTPLGTSGADVEIPGEGLRADLDLTVHTIQEAHFDPYAHESKEVFDLRCKKLRARLSRPLCPRAFYRELAPLVSCLRSDHTYVMRLDEFEQRLHSGGKVFPLSFEWDGERLWLTRHYGNVACPVGATVLWIGGEDSATVIRRIGRYIPGEGRPAHPWLVRREDWLWYWLWIEYGEADALELLLGDAAGAGRRYTVKAVPVSDLSLDPRQMRPDYAFRRLDRHATAIIEFNLFSDPARCCSFVDETFAEIRRSGICDIILDLRRCRGGMSTGVERLLQYLLHVPFVLYSKVQTKVSPLTLGGRIGQDPGAEIGSVITHYSSPIEPVEKAERFSGRISVLVGPLTYSNAVSCAHALRYYRGSPLIGEVSGGSTASCGGQQPLRLPHSGLFVGIATQYVVCPGTEGGGGTLVPDHEAKPTPEDSARGVDRAIRVALRVMQGNRSNR